MGRAFTIGKQPQEVFSKKGVLQNFTNFAGNHLCQNLFCIKVAGWREVFYKKHLFYRTPLVAASDYKYFILKSHRSSHPEVLCEKGVPENFTNFTGKHLFQSLFLKKVAGPGLSGVISNNRLPFSNSYLSFVSRAVCKSKIFRISFLLVISSCRKDKSIWRLVNAR